MPQVSCDLASEDRSLYFYAKLRLQSSFPKRQGRAFPEAELPELRGRDTCRGEQTVRNCAAQSQDLSPCVPTPESVPTCAK